jgi:hypothetical protein
LDNLSANYLLIPTQMGDYIRPGEYWGPNEFMGLPAVKSVVKRGDRVFGRVQVYCTRCAKMRGYWLFIKVGEGGWYAEQEQPRALAGLSGPQQVAANFDASVDILAPLGRSGYLLSRLLL